ncbi:MAG: hypothetical protein ACYDBB_22545 [Armatimonadota bacterium]
MPSREETPMQGTALPPPPIIVGKREKAKRPRGITGFAVVLLILAALYTLFLLAIGSMLLSTRPPTGVTQVMLVRLYVVVAGQVITMLLCWIMAISLLRMARWARRLCFIGLPLTVILPLGSVAVNVFGLRLNTVNSPDPFGLFFCGILPLVVAAIGFIILTRPRIRQAFEIDRSPTAAYPEQS